MCFELTNLVRHFKYKDIPWRSDVVISAISYSSSIVIL